MATGNNIRRTITNLRDPQQIRELNRQLEWIWNQLLGGLTDRAFSAVGRTKITEVVQNKIAENINADSATVVELKAALADLMVATIAVAEIDWAHIVDLSADRLSALNAVIKSLDAQHVDATTLNAAIADLAVLEAGSATFDRATVTHLVSNALNLQYGTLNEVFIQNLSVLYAQIANATIGDLCLKAADGTYYLIDVNSNGQVTATAKNPQPTAQEISDGVTEGGQHIVETSITAQEMNTQTLHGTFALINMIDAARINVGQLFAQQAFVDELNTSIIQSNSFIQLSVIANRLSDVVRVVSDGLHIYGASENGQGQRTLSGNQVHISDTGMDVLLENKRYSRFAARYAQFGEYHIRRAADNGLVFKLGSPLDDDMDIVPGPTPEGGD